MSASVLKARGDWQSVRLADVCVPGLFRDPTQEPEKLFKYIDISSVDNNGKRIVGAQTLVGRDAPSRARKVIRAGDVLVANVRPNLNAVALVPNGLDDEICSTGFTVLRPSESIASDYLFSFVRSEGFVRSLSELVKGALYPAVTDKQVLGMEIPLPSIAEQKRIAAILNEQMAAVEKARAAAEAQVSDGGRLETAYFRQAFRGIVPLAASEIDQLEPPQGWRWYLLGDLARLESGHTPSRNRPDWWGGEVPWLALPDIRNLDGKLAVKTAENTNDEGLANSSARLLPESTVCLSRTASVGFVTILGRPMATSQDFINWICGTKLDAFFLMHLLRASRDYVRSLSSGAIHKTVYMPTVKALRVCVPDVQEQREIAALLNTKLNAAEALRGSISQTVSDVELLPAALLRRAFSGQL